MSQHCFAIGSNLISTPFCLPKLFNRIEYPWKHIGREDGGGAWRRRGHREVYGEKKREKGEFWSGMLIMNITRRLSDLQLNVMLFEWAMGV